MTKDVCITGKDRDLSYSLIWAALWIAALASLLLVPAFSR